MKQYKQLLINGIPIEEGYVTNKWMDMRFNSNKNILLAFIGATGSGKSYSCMRMCELWYQHRFNKTFPVEHICFSIEQAMRLINSGKLSRGDLIIFEEAGVNMGNLDFQTKLNKFFGYVLQAFRCKNIGVIFNLPNFNMLSKTARTLLHGVFQTVTINIFTKQVIIKPFYLQTNPLTGKPYTKYLKLKMNHHYVKIERLGFSLPSEELTKPYEDIKDKFVNKISADLLETIESEDENGKLIDRDTNFKTIQLLYESGITKVTHLMQKTGLDYSTVRKGINKLVLAREKEGKPLGNTSLTGNLTIPHASSLH